MESITLIEKVKSVSGARAQQRKTAAEQTQRRHGSMSVIEIFQHLHGLNYPNPDKPHTAAHRFDCR